MGRRPPGATRSGPLLPGTTLFRSGRVGAAARRDYSVTGDTANLASRLETNARPGSVLVSSDLMRRIRGQFAFGPLRRLEVKGKSAPVEALELLRELSEAERGADPQDEPPFVGRAELVDRLAGLWNRPAARAAHGVVRGPGPGAGRG